jgi:hypothetical protein
VSPWSQERITLVIESDAVRLMGVLRGAVTRWASAPLPRGTLEDGAVGEPGALAQVLERLWATHSQARPLPRGGVVMAIPGRHVASRLEPVVGPELPDEDEMALHARKVLPRPDAYHAWQLVGASPQQALFVLAAPMALVDGYVQAMEIAGLGVSAVDVKPLALVRAVGQRYTIIVDTERAFGTIIIVDDALPRQVRVWPLDAPLLAAPEEKVMRVVEALHDAIVQYNAESLGRALHPAVPIFLSGTLADHPLLRDVIREVLGHPIGQVAPPIQVPPDLPLNQFLANIGLAQKRL